jgi:hypothetical protein
MLYSALFSREPKLLFETVQIKTILGWKPTPVTESLPEDPAAKKEPVLHNIVM